MNWLEDTPLEGFLNDAASTAAEPYSRGPVEALALTEADLTAVDAEHSATGTAQPVSGFGEAPPGPGTVGPMLVGAVVEDFILPAVFRLLNPHGERRAKRAIVNATKEGVFEAGEAIADAIMYQLMAVGEQGELLAKYRSLYGVVVDSPDPNARCK